jgi:hypothetical protein
LLALPVEGRVGPSGEHEVRSATALAGPVHVPERKLEDVLRDGASLPGAVVLPLVQAVRVVAERQLDHAPAGFGLTPVAPGSLGSWSEAESGSG